MKDLFYSMRRNGFKGLLILLLVASLTSFTIDNDHGQAPTSGILAFNLAPDLQNVGFAISGNKFTTMPLAFSNYTGGYQPIYPGKKTIETFDFYKGTTIANSKKDFQDGKFYSSFLIGYNGNYENLVVSDNLEGLQSHKDHAYIRFVQAINNTGKQPSVTISNNGEKLMSETAAYKTVSTFKSLKQGKTTISINDGADVKSSLTMNVEADKVYTILLMGTAGETDADSVQIKSIQNGTVTEQL